MTQELKAALQDHLEQLNLTGAQCDGVMKLVVPAVETLERICAEADRIRLILSPSDAYREGLVEGLTRARSTAMPALAALKEIQP